MNNSDQPRIALIYDKVNTSYGGAEQVLIALHQEFPQAVLYTSLVTSSAHRWLADWSVVTSWLQMIPEFIRLHQLLTPLFPLAFESLDLEKIDIVISVTSSQAKGVLTKPNQLHICYLLTPTRYLFSHHDKYLNQYMLLRLPIVKQLLKYLTSYLRYWDYVAAYRPDHIIPISRLVAERVQQYYHRQTETVVYPTVLSRIPVAAQPDTKEKKYGVVISRLVAYKRVDLAIRACNHVHIPLLIVGAGADEYALKKLFPTHTFVRKSGQTISHFIETAEKLNKTILFAGHCTEEEKLQIYGVSRLAFMLGIEDFGITALEACLQDIPVIVHQHSGVSELIKDHAVMINEETLEQVITAINQTLANPPVKMSLTDKQKLTTKKFASNFSKLVYDLWHRHQKLRKDFYVIS